MTLKLISSVLCFNKKQGLPPSLVRNHQTAKQPITSSGNLRNNLSFQHMAHLPVSRFQVSQFLAPSGAQGVTMSVCLYGTKLSRALNLHYSSLIGLS